MRFSVRHLMGIVAIAAVLTPFPFEALLFLAFAAIVWSPFALFAFGIGRLPDGERHPLIVLVVAVLGLFVFLVFLAKPSTREIGPLYAALIGLTLLNLIGPLYAAGRLGQRRYLLAGEILWAWQGVVCTMLPVLAPHDPSGQVFLVSQFARLTVVLASLLALYGVRPTRPGSSSWGHYVGWTLLEINAMTWGWSAWLILRRWGGW